MNIIMIGPNGLSLRPMGINLWDIVSNYNGKITVVRIPKNTPIPEELVLLHEHSDHYSMQTAIPCSPSELNKRLAEFLAPFEKLTVPEFTKKYPVENCVNHDN